MRTRSLGAALLALSLAVPGWAQGDDPDLGFGDIPRVEPGSIRGAALLPGLGGGERPLELPGALDRIAAAVLAGQPVSQDDYELVAAYARRAPEAHGTALETVDGDGSLDALLDAVVPSEGSDQLAEAGVDPLQMGEVANQLEALSSDLFLYQMGASLADQGGQPYARMGGGSAGGLDPSAQARLSESYLPGIQGRIVESARTLRDVLQKG